MIRPPGFGGAVFGTAAEGDARSEESGRRSFATAGAPKLWAFVAQVHGDRVLRAETPGLLGEADAVYTTRPDLAIAVATADCVPVIMEGPGFAALTHAGWRGIAAGVVTETRRVLASRGLVPSRAAIGPAIGPCCYEVDGDVVERFPDYAATTTWGTPSVDLRAAVTDQLGDLPLWISDRCTYTDAALFSFRRNRTPHRQVAVAWSSSA